MTASDNPLNSFELNAGVCCENYLSNEKRNLILKKGCAKRLLRLLRTLKYNVLVYFEFGCGHLKVLRANK